MKNDTVRQIAVVLTTLTTLAVNGAANAIPLNGRNTGEISAASTCSLSRLLTSFQSGG